MFEFGGSTVLSRHEVRWLTSRLKQWIELYVSNKMPAIPLMHETSHRPKHTHKLRVKIRVLWDLNDVRHAALWPGFMFWDDGSGFSCQIHSWDMVCQ